MNKSLINISFVIIEFNSVSDVIKCVSSLTVNCRNLNYEIIVSSNSQYDIRKQNFLEQRYPEIIWSFNEKNGGFAYGMNRGIEKTQGEYIILQNPDTSVLTDNIGEVLNFMRDNISIGLIGPQIINNSGEIQDSCRPFVTPIDIFKRLIKRKLDGSKAILESDFDYNKTQPVNWIIGAFMIVSRRVINEVGMLNEKFFMYIEDMDWCFRVWENDYKVIYYPQLIVNYEGDRKSTLKKKNILPFNINKYTYYHVKNYFVFLLSHGFFKIKKMQIKSL